MSSGSRFKISVGAALLCGALVCLGPGAAFSATAQHQKKSKSKKEPLPPLASGPTGRPVQQIPLDSIAAVPPQVSYQDSQLTIVAPNSTLSDILRAVKKQTGAEIEIPAAPERVVTRLGPGPARDVVADLLNGSRFNYVLLGSAADDASLTRIVLVAKTGPQEITPNQPPPDPALGIPQAGNAAPPEEQAEDAPEAVEDTTADENGDQAADGEQPAQNQDQSGVKTPQQMLQEMQQRQMQLQQQQPPGMPPVPGTGMPPRPPQEQ